VLYGAFAAGRPSPLPDLPLQYADFAAWQRAWLSGERLAAQLDYWRAQLAGLEPLALPTDHPRPSVQGFRGATLPIELGAELTEALKALGRREGATLFMVLLAGFQALLGRYTGQDDVAVGSPIANRTRSELEGLIGFFVNSLVLRADLSGDPGFRALLGRVREATLGAYAHQDLPFEKLVEELQPARDPARNPLFQVMFALQNAPAPPLELPGLTLSTLELDVRTTRFDLELYLWEDVGRLNGLLVYDADLFEPATAGRLLRQFRTLLEGIVADPERRLSELPLASAVELEQLVAWSVA
jgi:non-ribosomal peptide synthetase component F